MRSRTIPIGVAVGVVVALGAGALLVHRAESKTNRVALASAPKPVTVATARAAQFRASRGYVGTLEPWVEAKIGPQIAQGFVDTVLVRPGAAVKKGEVLATLDCRNASATSQAVAMQARALEQRQEAIAHEAARVRGLLDGGFVSANEAERKTAESASDEAELLAARAKLMGVAVEVGDCVLRAPFDGEVATRAADPGAFARPGVAIVTVVNRSVVRVSADAPESDFAAVAPGTPVEIRALASGATTTAPVSRRAPAADPATRTIHFEIDLPNTDHKVAVDTTAELHIRVGEPQPSITVPLSAATVRNGKAIVFVVEGDVARTHALAVRGEEDGVLYLEPAIPPGSLVVTEGRALLSNGDAVAVGGGKEATP